MSMALKLNIVNVYYASKAADAHTQKLSEQLAQRMQSRLDCPKEGYFLNIFPGKFFGMPRAGMHVLVSSFTLSATDNYMLKLASVDGTQAAIVRACSSDSADREILDAIYDGAQGKFSCIQGMRAGSSEVERALWSAAPKEARAGYAQILARKERILLVEIGVKAGNELLEHEKNLLNAIARGIIEGIKKALPVEELRLK